MVGALLVLVSLVNAGQTSPQSKREQIRAATEEMRFQGAGYEKFDKTVWPLHHEGTSFTIGLWGSDPDMDANVVGYVSATFRAIDGGFDLQLLNALAMPFGTSGQINVLGELVVRAALPLNDTDPKKVRTTVRGFAFYAAMIAREAMAKRTSRLVSLPLAPGQPTIPPLVLDETRLVKFLAPHDLNLLVSHWSLEVSHGYAGSSTMHWLPYQYDGIELTVRQNLGDEPDPRHLIIEALDVAYTLFENASGDRQAALKVRLQSWEVSASPFDGDRAIVYLSKSLKFGDGVALGAIKQFLIGAAVELKAALAESGEGRRDEG